MRGTQQTVNKVSTVSVDRNSFLQAPLHHLWIIGSSLTCENNSHITLSPSLHFYFCHWSWSRTQQTQAECLAMGNSTGLVGFAKTLHVRGQSLPLLPLCLCLVIPTLHLRVKWSARHAYGRLEKGWHPSHCQNPDWPSKEQKFPCQMVSKTSR